MLKISDEMRAKLRVPLPSEAVSQHPAKTYLSSIKSIYVAERINDVFGIGSWTLKSTPIEMSDKMVVIQAVLEIPEYGFYGESYGGNDNEDRGDAYKGATTDALTKIAAQQLEIGIDVFKGLQTGGGKPPATATHQKPSVNINPVEKQPTQEHYCKLHGVDFFKSPKMKAYAHPVKDKEGNQIYDENGKPLWCHEHRETTPEPPQSTEKQTKGEFSSKPPEEIGATSKYIDEESKADLISSLESNGVTENWLFDYIVGKYHKKLTDKDGVFHYEYIEKDWLPDIYTAMEQKPF